MQDAQPENPILVDAEFDALIADSRVVSQGNWKGLFSRV
jgi:hypothetical protein